MIVALVFLPLLAAIVAGLGNRAIGNVPAKLITTVALFASCALAWPIFIGFLNGTSTSHVVKVLSFISSGNLQVDWALRVDTLTAVMLVVVTSVSALVHLYSWGYMSEDPSQPRFFAYLSLFTFAMLMLVTSLAGTLPIARLPRPATIAASSGRKTRATIMRAVPSPQRKLGSRVASASRHLLRSQPSLG